MNVLNEYVHTGDYSHRKQRKFVAGRFRRRFTVASVDEALLYLVTTKFKVKSEDFPKVEKFAAKSSIIFY